MQSKLDVIHDAYGTIKQAAESDSYDTEEFARELDDVCRSYNMTVCVMDVNSNMKYVSINGGERLENRLIGYVFGLSIPFNDQRVIENGDDYVIKRTGQEDKEYLEIYGRLNTGISFIMQTPLSSIQESAKIANRFYALAGCLGAMAGGIIIWFVSRSVTKPILELNNISKRMVQLDFEAKYQGKAHNEIDLLGENINKLSDSLEKTISELKTANNELQRDVEKKEAIDEMRKEFLANVSHELKTPIALIQGYAEGLQEEINDDPESRQFYCDVIVDEAAKMNNMVKKLLTLNQLEFGNDVVAMERFDLTALVKNYIQSAAILTKQHEITVRMEEYPPIYAWADEFKIEEVFMNFFSNAVNHCEDDKIIEVDWEGNIIWSWRASDHFDELGFDEAAKNALFRNPGLHGEAGGDWMHINNFSTLGENKWYDAGDKRFHPDNIIFDARNSNILGIIEKSTGKIVWRVGPNFNESEATKKLGWIIGQHHLHMIPKGLPGEGDLLVFDNGGEGGYGTPNPASLTGVNNAHRDYSRVLQFNPVTLEITWQYTPLEAGNLLFTDASKFYSSYISSAQRLPNGNTLITEGSDGHLLEVTPDHEIVWEFVNPYFKNFAGTFKSNMIYRAYRAPYEWIPQLEKPVETSIEPIDITKFRVPGASIGEGTGLVTAVDGIDPTKGVPLTGSGNEEDDEERIDFCVASVKKKDLE